MGKENQENKVEIGNMGKSSKFKVFNDHEQDGKIQMKKIFILALLLCLSTPVFAKKMRIAVMDFKPDGVSKSIARKVSELIRSNMINIGKYIVIERAQMKQILKEQGFQRTGCTDVTCAVKIGKILSANKILVGTVMDMEGTIIITGRIVDVESGAGEFSHDQEVESKKRLYKGVKLFTSNLSSRINGVQSIEITDNDEPIKKSAPDGRFTIMATSIIDTKTGLEWQKRPPSDRMDWNDALSYAESLELAGYSDWRLPRKEELLSLMKHNNKRSCDVLNKNGFKNIKPEIYWTSTFDSSDGNNAWCIDVETDFADTDSKERPFYVWVVRKAK